MNRFLIFLTVILTIAPMLVRASAEDAGAMAPADCIGPLTDEKSLIEQLARMSLRNSTSKRYQKLFTQALDSLGFDKADLEEAIDLQILFLKSQEPDVAIRPINGDKILAADRRDIEKAYNYARTNMLGIQGALMKAIKEREYLVVRGLLLMSLKSEQACSGQSGISSFCKQLDLDAGWKNQNYLAEASNFSKAIALFLIENGAVAPAQDLIETHNATSVATGLIAQGQSMTFKEALAFQDDTVTLKLLELGKPFSIKDLGLTIAANRFAIFEAAIQQHPELASKITAEMLAQTIANKQTVFFERILELNPNLAARKGKLYPVETAALHNNVPAAKILLEKYKVDPSRSPKTTKNDSDDERTDDDGEDIVGDDSSDKSMNSLALIYSARHADAVILKMLLADGRMNVRLKTRNGETALSNAIDAFCAPKSSYSKEAIIELILAGADVNAVIKGSHSFRFDPQDYDSVWVDKGPWTPLKIVLHYYNHTWLYLNHVGLVAFQDALGELAEILEANDAK